MSSLVENSGHLEVDTAPTFTTAHPIELSRLKQQLAIPDVSEYDSELLDMVQSVTNDIQESLAIQIPQATYIFYRDGFRDDMQLRRLPATVSNVKYLDSDGTEQTLSTSVYRVIQEGNRQRPAIVQLGYNQTWPITYGVDRDVYITFTCGYASGSVPVDLQQLITMCVSQLYFGFDNTRQMAIDRKMNTLRWTT